MNRLMKKQLKIKIIGILTWVGEFRPGKTIYTVFDEESDVQVKNQQILRPEGKNKEKHFFTNLFLICYFSFFVLF